MRYLGGFGRFIMVTLYAKVRAYLLGGTGAAGLAGAILWGASALGVTISAPVAGFVTAAAAVLVGLYVAYETRERARAPAP